jgi:hypothetical protein
MPISDILKLKISKPSLYSLLLTSLGLAIMLPGLALAELIKITDLSANFVESALMVVIVIGAIIFAGGVVYNGFFGSLKIGPIYVTGSVTRLAEVIFQKKIFLIPVALAVLIAGIFVSKVSFVGSLLMVIFLLTIFILNFPFLVSYYQLIKNDYLPLRQILEDLDQLNKKTLYYSILKEIESEDEFVKLVNMAKKEKNRQLLKRVLFQEINYPYISRETVTVLLLNTVLSDEDPPNDFSKSLIFWQERAKKGG